MNKPNSLLKEIKSLNLVFKVSYFLVTLIASVGVILFNHSSQEKLARSYSLATRNSIVIRDYRQALTSLAPAVDDGFSGVEIVNYKKESVLQIPTNETIRSNSQSILTTSIIENLSVDNTRTTNIAYIIFYYSIFTPLIICIFVSIALFFIFSQIFKQARKRLEEHHSLIIHQKELEAASQLAAQVAHDIRSPLSALNMMTSTFVDSNNDKSLMIKSAVQRINDIANELLEKGKEAPKKVDNDCESAPVCSVIENIITEKKNQYRHKNGLNFTSDFQHAQNVYARIQSSELSRVLSNLINNSVEAFDENHGNITVSVRMFSEKVSIIIQDDGKGIPEEILSKLGTRGLTHGKNNTKSGTGLGIWHAKSTVESTGGDFRVLSKVGIGTQIIINLLIANNNQNK